MTILVDPRDGAAGTIFLTGGYERPETEFIKRFVHPGMVVLDIGANIGAHTLLLAQCIGEQGCVHAFEPTVAGDLLKRSLLANHITRVVLNPIALGGTSGSLRLTRCTRGNEAFTSIGTPLYAAAADGYIDVPAETLDDYVDNKGLTTIDFAKMDIEGAEVLVLRGAAATVASHLVRAWLLEMNEVCLRSVGHSPEQLEGLLTDAGYTLFLLDDDGWPLPFQMDKVRKDRDILALSPATLEEMRDPKGPWGDTFCAFL